MTWYRIKETRTVTTTSTEIKADDEDDAIQNWIEQGRPKWNVDNYIDKIEVETTHPPLDVREVGE